LVYISLGPPLTIRAVYITYMVDL